MNLIAAVSINVIQHSNNQYNHLDYAQVIMVSVTYNILYCSAERHYAECRYANCHYAECHFAECCYAECHYAECHYAECQYY